MSAGFLRRTPEGTTYVVYVGDEPPIMKDGDECWLPQDDRSYDLCQINPDKWHRCRGLPHLKPGGGPVRLKHFELLES